MNSKDAEATSILLEQIDSQILWYSKKSKYYKTIETYTHLFLIVLSVSIPFLIACSFENTKYVVAFLSALIAFTEGFRNFVKSREKWIAYRTTLERLKQEKTMFKTYTGIYFNQADGLNLLSERYFQIINNEHAQWKSDITPQEKPKENNP